MGRFTVKPEDQELVNRWARDIVTAIRFGQTYAQNINEIPLLPIAIKSGKDATYDTVGKLLVEDYTNFVPRLKFIQKGRRKRSPMLGELGKFCREISEPMRSFSTEANEIAAFVSSLILGSCGYIYGAPNRKRRTQRGNNLNVPNSLTSASTNVFFSHWEKCFDPEGKELLYEDWYKDWSNKFRGWVNLCRGVIIEPHGKNRSHADKQFDVLINGHWRSGPMRRGRAFLPVQVWASHHDWYKELCYNLDVDLVESP